MEDIKSNEQINPERTNPEQTNPERTGAEQARAEQAASEQPLPDESFDELIRGRYRAAFAGKLREILARQTQAQRDYLEYQRLRAQEAQTRSLYPELKLADELDDPEFVRLLRSGVGLKTAYEAIHHGELMRRQAESRLETLQKTAQRPVENALGETAPTRTDVEPGAMSAKERRQLRRRAERGEKISF